MAGVAGNSTEVGSIHYDLDLDDEKFKGKLNSASKEAGGFTSSLKNAEEGSKAFALGLTAIGAGIVAFGVKSVQAYKESETAGAQLNAVLASTHGIAGLYKEDLDDQAQALMNLTGVSDEAVTAGQAMLLTFTNIRGGTMQKATDTLLDMATAMNSGVVPSSEQMKQQAIQLGKALNDPIDGVTKLTKVGVTFTDQQKEEIKKLQEAGDMAGAQSVMLRELQTEFGGSAKMAGQTFAGQMNIAKENFGNFMEVIGEGIVNSLRPMVAGFNEWFTSIGGAQGMMDILNNFLQNIKQHLPVIATVIVAGLVPALYAMATGVWAVMAPLLPFLAVGLAIGLALQALIDHFGGLGATLQAMQPFFDILGRVWGQLIYPALQSVWQQITQQLLPSLQNLWNTVAPVLIPVLKFLGEVLGVIIVGSIMLAIGAIKVIIWYIGQVADNISWVIQKIKDVIGWFREFANAPGQTLKDAGQAIINAFKGAFDWLKNKFKEAKDWMNELNPFTRHSPSLIDNITRGVGIIKDQYGSLNDISLNPVSQLAPDYRTLQNGNSLSTTINFYGDINNTEDKTLDDIGGRVANRQLTLARNGVY